jgi:hypothetical protein
MPGVATLEAEVTNISAHGFWIFLGTDQLPAPYDQFPCFRDATVDQISTVERPVEYHLLAQARAMSLWLLNRGW